jgi:two-component system, LytTR family, sensor kinase
MSESFDRQIRRKSPLVNSRLLLLISAGCLVPAVLALLQEYVQARLAGHAPRWQDLAFPAGDWLFLAVLTPIPSYFGTRFQFRPGRRTLALAGHIVGAVAFCLIWSAFGLGLGWLLHRYPAVGPLWPAYFNWALIATPFSVLMYCGVLGCVYAFLYFVQIQEREAYAERLTAQLAEARLGALRMQLNPHFLFNSLNALSVLVRDQNIGGSLRVLELLSDVLHQVLSADQQQEILLADELKVLEKYFAIEQVRFSDRLRINWNVDERARLAYVPSFLLQPLVENAIKHGIAKRADSGRIDISAHVLGHRLELSVRDDGVGVKSSYAEGVGLSNTRERLRTLYGDDGSLTITPTAEGGTAAILHIPFRPKVS